MVTVLFTDIKSNYNKLECDTWNITRNALNYKGNDPIIAHPPCRSWSKLKAFSKAPGDEKQLAIWSINLIRKNGGILEHPKGSDLWKELKLPKGKEIDKYGGFTLNINQSWFGHPCEKNTNLYIVGISPDKLPTYKITFDTPTKKVQYQDKSHRSTTPIELCNYLISIIEEIKKYKQINQLQNENPL